MSATVSILLAVICAALAATIAFWVGFKRGRRPRMVKVYEIGDDGRMADTGRMAPWPSSIPYPGEEPEDWQRPPRFDDAVSIPEVAANDLPRVTSEAGGLPKATDKTNEG